MAPLEPLEILDDNERDYARRENEGEANATGGTRGLLLTMLRVGFYIETGTYLQSKYLSFKLGKGGLSWKRARDHEGEGSFLVQRGRVLAVLWRRLGEAVEIRRFRG